MEKIVKGLVFEVVVFLIDSGEDDWSVRFNSTGISSGILNFGEVGSKFGRANMGHDVREMMEDQNFLG